jgi:hypothetical protein
MVVAPAHLMLAPQGVARRSEGGQNSAYRLAATFLVSKHHTA